MARTATVTKGSVTKNQDGSYTVTLNLVYADGATELFAKSYSVRYVAGENPTNLGSQIKKDMQTDIDAYKASQTILNSTTLTNIVNAINNTLEV